MNVQLQETWLNNRNRFSPLVRILSSQDVLVLWENTQLLPKRYNDSFNAVGLRSELFLIKSVCNVTHLLGRSLIGLWRTWRHWWQDLSLRKPWRHVLVWMGLFQNVMKKMQISLFFSSPKNSASQTFRPHRWMETLETLQGVPAQYQWMQILETLQGVASRHQWLQKYHRSPPQSIFKSWHAVWLFEQKPEVRLSNWALSHSLHA